MTDVLDSPSGPPASGTPDFRSYDLSDRYTKDDGRGVPLGRAGPGAAPVRAVARRPRPGLEHGGVRVRLSGLTAGRLRQGGRHRRAGWRRESRIVVQPGLNEELAATAVMGTQLAITVDGCRYDGVIGIWYGKAPGLDRASDAIRHAVFAGTRRHGGAWHWWATTRRRRAPPCRVVGATLVDLNIPILYPGDVQEALDLGRHAIALSRARGLWTSLKVVAAVADGTGTVELHPDRITPIVPDHRSTASSSCRTRPASSSRRTRSTWSVSSRRSASSSPAGTASINRPQHDPRRARRRLDRHRRQRPHVPRDARGAAAARAAHRRARSPTPASACCSCGMPIPLDPDVVREFAGGLDRGRRRRGEEPDARVAREGRALLGEASRPIVVGKRDERRTARPAHRHARRRHASWPRARGSRLARNRLGDRVLAPAAVGTREADPARRSTARRSSAPGARTTRRRRCPTARSSAPASVATRWWC